MFNVGLPEFAVIALLGLIVVGPERLPGLARQAAQWLVRFREEAGRSLSELRAAADIDDVANEVRTLRDELRATKAELGRAIGEPSRAVAETAKEVSAGGPTPRRAVADDPGGAPPFDTEAT